MRTIISIFLLGAVALGITLCVVQIPFGMPKTKVGTYYVEEGVKQTGATNIVTSVVVSYRAFDTLGEITVLLIAAIGLGAVLATGREKPSQKIEPASLVLYTGCRLLFPLILLFGAYLFIHGHITPGGGFQGGAVVASGFVLTYLGCRGKRISQRWSKVAESLGGLAFVGLGLVGLAVAGYFLKNVLPYGIPNSLFSAGIIPIIYIAIGFKVGSELAAIIDNLVEEGK